MNVKDLRELYKKDMNEEIESNTDYIFYALWLEATALEFEEELNKLKNKQGDIR